MTPTARSLKLLRSLGYVAQVVERWCPHSKRRIDLFGVIDIISAHPKFGILGVQATTTTNVSKRLQKAREEPRLQVWLAAGGHFEVWGWALRGKAGKRKRWTLSIREIVENSP